MIVRNADDLDGETKRLYAHEDPGGRQSCRFITTPINMANTHYAWTYNYPGELILTVIETDLTITLSILEIPG